MPQRKKYFLGDLDLFSIRNRNEPRVIACIRSTLEALGNPDLPEKVIQDVYAYALNQLPARYAQTGSIVLRDPVHNNEIQAVVSQALERVMKNPKK